MSDNGPESLTLRYLRSIDERLTQFQADTARGFETVTGHLVALTGRVAGLETRMSAMESWSVDATRRLERIERRLDLVGTP
jgi:hypothetical protein